MQVDFWSFLVLISTMRSSQCIVLSQRLMRKGANKHYAHLRCASTASGFQGFDSNFNTARQSSHEDLHKLSRENPDLFWGTLAKARLRWMQEFNKVQECQMKDGKFSWFLNGKLNIAGKSAFWPSSCINEMIIELYIIIGCIFFTCSVPLQWVR